MGSLLTHALACLFGMGSWVSINGMFVELPLLVAEVPEGWYLPSYLIVLVQLANVGPLFFTLMHRFQPGRLGEVPVVYTIVSVGILASFLLAFLWKEQLVVGGVLRSVSLLALTFFLSIVDCTSSVTFLPFMMRLQPQYLTTYFVGEGLSGLVPALLALVQGVGVLQCTNGTSSGIPKLEPTYLPPKFSPQTFFIFLGVMMVTCLLAFLLLNHHPSVKRERRALDPGPDPGPEENPMMQPFQGPAPKSDETFRTGAYSRMGLLIIFVILAWCCALTNAVLPSIQSYSCLPYGNGAYHLSATMGAVANPVACFVAMFFPIRSLQVMLSLTAVGSTIGAYIMAMAVLSPCPLLVHGGGGAVLIIVAWVLFVLTLTYVKVMIGLILRDEGRSALVWCGAVVQLGSMLGALSMFPVVSVYNLFTSGDPCNTTCP